jgi:phage/plasmid primase-like uncharacterized protein
MNAFEELRGYVDQVRQAASGRWRQTLMAVGIGAQFLYGKHGPCPGCGGRDRFRFDDLDGRGTFFCSRGGDPLSGDGFALLEHVQGCSFLAAVDIVAGVMGIERRAASNAAKQRHPTGPNIGWGVSDGHGKPKRRYDAYAADLFGEAIGIKASNVGGRYLLARNCVLPPEEGDLRLHPELKHPLTGYVGPALLARVTDALTGEPISLHRTWIASDGTKPTDPARMLLGGYRKSGGVIRLWPDDAVTHGLGIAEGIETALSLAHGFKPVWACIDAGNVKALPILEGVTALTIAVDHDQAGREAAAACADRWNASGREVRLVLPEMEGADLNDLACAA